MNEDFLFGEGERKSERGCGFCFNDGSLQLFLRPKFHTHIHSESEWEREMMRTRLYAPLMCAWGTWWSHVDGNLIQGESKSTVRCAKTLPEDWSLLPSDWGVKDTQFWKVLSLEFHSPLLPLMFLCFIYIFLSFCVVGSCLCGSCGGDSSLSVSFFFFLNSMSFFFF